MPFYLKEVDVVSEVAKFRSALIVPCRFCPAASTAVKNNKPFIRFFRRLLKTECYEDLIKNMQSRLEREGVRADVFKSGILHYVLCMWPSERRKRLLRRASEYEAVVVMGCDAAYESVCDVLRSTNCQVVHGMESEGVMTLTTRFNWPLNISLDLLSVTPVLHQKAE